MTLLELTLAMMAVIAPGRDHSTLGAAIATVVEAEQPLFVNDAGKTRTVALVVAIEGGEGSLRAEAQGDRDKQQRPHSFCAMQIHDSAGGTAALLTDPEACIRKGLVMLQVSARTDSAHPVAWYARGPRWCSVEAQRLSNDRMHLAARLEREARIP